MVFDEFQQRRQRHDALGRRLADQHRRVAHRERRKGIVLEFDRARDIEESPLVAEIVDRGDVDLGAHAALARFGGTVADRGACARRAAPADGPRGVEDALEQAGLAREIRPAQRHHAVRAAAWSASSDGLGFDVVHDNVLPSARSPAHESSGRWSLPNTSGAKPCPGNRFTPAGGINPPMWRRTVRCPSSQRTGGRFVDICTVRRRSEARRRSRTSLQTQTVSLVVAAPIFIAMAIRPQRNDIKG